MMLVGIIFILVGVLLWLYSVVIQKISDEIKNGRLLTTGVYSLVRNPIYSAFTFVFTGILIMENNVFLLILPIFFCIYLTVLNASTRSVATVMNIVPLVLEMDQDRPLDELIVQTARQLKLARRHGRYRSEQMRRDQARPGGQGRIHGPLLNILPFDAPYRQAGLDADQVVYSTGPVEDFNLNVRAAPDASGMRLQVE